MKTNQMPKTVQRWLDTNADKIADVYIENDGFEPEAGDFSIWCHFRPGWINEPNEVHMIHEPTAREFLEAAKYIKPCDCTDCKPTAPGGTTTTKTKTTKKTTAPKINSNRETWLGKGVRALTPIFTKAGYEVPKNIRVTCGWPSKSAGRVSKRRIGEAWDATASADGTIELIISMVLEDAVRVLDTLIHEMVHGVVGNEAGHGPAFKKCAIAVGLTGKMTATTAGDELKATLTKIADKLGPYPHAKLDFSSKSKQGTRLIKVTCQDNGEEPCGMIFRTTMKWIDQAEDGLACPACGQPTDTD